MTNHQLCLLGKCTCNNREMIMPCGTLEAEYCKNCGCESERGLWVQCRKGRMEPLYPGYNMIEQLLNISNDEKIIKNLKKLREKIKQFRREQKK